MMKDHTGGWPRKVAKMHEKRRRFPRACFCKTPRLAAAGRVGLTYICSGPHGLILGHCPAGQVPPPIAAADLDANLFDVVSPSEAD